jgi:hypothetical protein
MRESISYKQIPPNTDEFTRLQQFAESFDHVVENAPGVVVHALYRGDICFGYSDTVYLPVTYPAFHPKVATPRDVIQVMNDWKAHAQLSGQRGYIGVPLNNRDGAGNFPEETMNKLGLARMHRELYTPY